MFSLHDFVLDTILKMIGNVADFNVQRYAISYYEKELLNDEDMLKIQSKIEEQYKVEEPSIEEENPEEITEETDDNNEEETDGEM